MRALKIAGIALLAFVLLMAALVGIVAVRYDETRIKAEIARVMMEKKQRRLAIDGELQLALWPRLGLRIGKLSLSERGSEQVFATLEAARVAVQVKPLFSHQIVVDELAIEGLRATVVRHKDGTLNIDDLLAPDESQSEPARIELAGIQAADLQIAWRDEKTGMQAALNDLDLTTGPIHADSGAQTLQVRNLALAAKGKWGSKGGELKLSAPDFAAGPAQASAPDMTVDAALTDGKRRLAARLALAGTEVSAKALRIGKLVLNLDARADGAEVKAALTSPLAADFEHRRLALEKLSGSIDLGHPQLPMKRLKLPVEASLHADLAKASAGGHLTTRLDGAKAALKFDVARFAPLALGFDLDIDRLDLDKYLPRTASAPAAKAGGDGKFDLAALKEVELNGSIRIGSLQAANVKVSKLQLQVKAANGRVDVAPR